MPAISVIVPNYNHARFLRQRINSILAQRLQDFELILLDDCSTDESQTILKGYGSDPRVRVDFNKANSGSPFKQWNKGVRLARGKYVWIAESDDYADTRFLERLVPLLDASPGMQLAYCRSWSITADDHFDGFAEDHFLARDQDCWNVDYHADGTEICRNYMIRTNIIQNASAVLFRKSAYERAGGADESMRLCGDWKLWASLMLMGEMAYVAEPLNYFRFHVASVRERLSLSGEGIPEWLAVVRWIMDRASPPEEILRKARADQAGHWVPIVLSLRVPWQLRREILRRVRAIDPHPIRSALRPALATMQRKFARHWEQCVRGLRGS